MAIPLAVTARVGAYIAKMQLEGPEVATRKASQEVLQVAAEHVPSLVGGSADLAPSTAAWAWTWPALDRLAAHPAQESVPADQEEASSPPPARSAMTDVTPLVWAIARA